MSAPDPRATVTQILEAAATGDAAAAADLLPLVYGELRRLAAARLRQRDGRGSLQATALVHEAWLKLCGGEAVTFRGKNHFFAAAALAMRHVLVDRARRRGRKKRGGGDVPQELLTDPAVRAGEQVDLLDLDAALGQLAGVHARAAQVVELRYFAGLNNQEVAAVLEVGDATVERDWKFAKAWLHRALCEGRDG